MLDPRLLRGDPEAGAARLATRGFRLDVERFRTLDERRRALQVRPRSCRTHAIVAPKEAKARGRDIAPLLAEAELQAVLAQL